MSSYLDRLNLRPFEKRLVVVVAAMLFLVLNAVFVWPHFSDWGQVKFRMSKSQDKLNLYRSATNQIPNYQALISRIQSEENADVLPEDQAVQFARTILDYQAQSGVTIGGATKPQARTNQFFLEQSETISVTAKEDQLVDFLYGLGSGNAMIRVRDLSLKPDLPRHQLTANIKLVASYQKKRAGKLPPGPPTAGRSTAASAVPAPPGPANTRLQVEPAPLVTETSARRALPEGTPASSTRPSKQDSKRP